MQTIKATVVMEIPEDKIVIAKSEYQDLLEAKDAGKWWDSKDVEKYYHHNMEWLRNNILLIPKYKRILSTENGGCVHYSQMTEGNRYWAFEPVRFKKFMQEYFSEINRG